MVTQDTTENNENKIVFFGRNKETSDKPANTENQEVEKKETIENSTTEEKITDTQKETDATKSEVKSEEVEQSKVIENEVKTDKEGKPTFKVVPKEVEKTETKQEARETETLSEDKVKSFLKSKYGIDVTDFNQFSQPEKLSDAVSEFKKFNESTGRGIDAYYNSKRDWAKEDKDTTIKEYLKYQEPLLTNEDIDAELKLLKLTEEEKDELSPREIAKAEQDYKKTYAKALSYMKNVSKEYALPKEVSSQEAKPLTPEEKAKAYKPYWDKRDKSLEKLNEVSVNLDGLGELKTSLSQEHKDLITQATQTEEDFFKRWQDSKGVIDTDKSSLDIAWSIPEIRNEFISEMVGQAYTKMVEKFSKEKRNVTIDSKKEKRAEERTGGFKTFGANTSSKRMGTPLIPAKN